MFNKHFITWQKVLFQIADVLEVKTINEFKTFRANHVKQLDYRLVRVTMSPYLLPLTLTIASRAQQTFVDRLKTKLTKRKMTRPTTAVPVVAKMLTG